MALRIEMRVHHHRQGARLVVPCKAEGAVEDVGYAGSFGCVDGRKLDLLVRELPLRKATRSDAYLGAVLVDIARIRDEEQDVDAGEGRFEFRWRGLVRGFAHLDSGVNILLRYLLGMPADENDLIVGNKLQEMSVGAGSESARRGEDSDRHFGGSVKQ